MLYFCRDKKPAKRTKQIAAETAKKKKKKIERMAGRLSNVASKIMGGNGVVGRSVTSSLLLRSGMGLPVGKHIVPDKPVSISPSPSPSKPYKHIYPLRLPFESSISHKLLKFNYLKSFIFFPFDSGSCERRIGLGQWNRIPRALYRSYCRYSWKGEEFLGL